MKCPHCSVMIHPGFTSTALNPNGVIIGREIVHGHPVDTTWHADWMTCPSCRRAIIQLSKGFQMSGPGKQPVQRFIVYPRRVARASAPAVVPNHIAEDFNEARTVLDDSSKASAALSRRCLQATLNDQGFVHRDLAPAIQAAIDSGRLPTQIADNLDAIRNIGNFAAHPLKDTNTGEILPVEPHEAEWNLEVLEGLFDFFYVQPAAAKAKRDALNAKLEAAGKPPMK